MSKTVHRIFILILAFIILCTSIYLITRGLKFYRTGIEDRFFHPDYKILKPSGFLGHGYGILGSFFMLIGVLTYMLRKRIRSFAKFGLLKYWLEFHIFLCTLGPILVLFHTSFKFGGIVAISFWSMVAVFTSGIVGRFIYIQIPRTIEGRELSLSEVSNLKTNIDEILITKENLSKESRDEIIAITKKRVNLYYSNIFKRYFNNYLEDKKSIHRVKHLIKDSKLSKKEYKNVINVLKNEIHLNRRIERLTTMQNLLKYWHVAHLPFAFIMLIVMIVHVVIAVTFGAKWIF
ncbi:MAG: hypothetical protein NTZ33_08790 [Bacteroidetes bacterium]|nr:hypothetical protein [Bacteroidota bacterium]